MRRLALKRRANCGWARPRSVRAVPTRRAAPTFWIRCHDGAHRPVRPRRPHCPPDRRRRHDGRAVFPTVVTLVPFAIGPDLALLRRIGPAILWLGALLSSLLALDRLFANDHEDGSLDLILMARPPLELVVATKALAHWMTTGLPLVAASPVLGLFLNLEPAALSATALTLLAG